LVVVVGFLIEFFHRALCFGLFWVFGLFFKVLLVVVVGCFPLLCMSHYGGFLDVS